jgi:hypothetical protein
MTADEWDVSANSQAMLAALEGRGTERLWRLFAVACVRRIETLMRYEPSRKALDVAERFADGEVTAEHLRVARVQAEAAAHQAHYDEWADEARAGFCWDAQYEAMLKARTAAEDALPCVAEEISNARSLRDGLVLPDILREVFGNPFRWTVVDPAWLACNDRAVLRLAEGIYAERAFDRMPILGDALEEAGCADADVLRHCRQSDGHVRGCWVLDLLLAKE